MKKTLYLMAYLIILASCKKEDSPSPTTGNSNNNGSSSNIYYGNLESQLMRIYYFSGDSLISTGSDSKLASAQFSSQAFVNEGTILGTSISAGNVSLNGTTLKENLTSNVIHYNDTTYSITSPPQMWNVGGASQVAAFTYTNNDTFPVINANPVLPDTVYKSSGFTIPFTGVNGYDDIRIYLSGGSGYVFQTYPSSTNSINISPSQLANFSTGNLILQIMYRKNNIQTINGKNYMFRSITTKYIIGMVLQP